MRFIDKCRELIALHGDDSIRRKNGTLLLKPGKIPRARHMFYKPLDQDIMEEHLIKAYKNKMPEEYVKLLSVFNGVDLYMVKANFKNGLAFAICRFSVYGLPLTPTSLRNEYGEEPLDVRMMDLERHGNIPQSWLKVASYRKHMHEDVRYDIFIDTLDERCYCCKKRTIAIVEKWQCLDDCLCDIFDYLSTTEWEFEVNS